MNDRTIVDFIPPTEIAFTAEYEAIETEPDFDAQVTGVYFFGPAAYANTCPGMEF